MNTYNPRSPRTPAHNLLPPFDSPSPTSDYYSELTASTTKFFDPTTLLSQRWHHFASQIASARLERDTVVALNRNLDEAENILMWRAREVIGPTNAGFGLGIARDSDERGGEKTRSVAQITPPASATPDAPALVGVGSPRQGEDEGNAALMGRLTKAVEQLRRRQEEFKHLHNVAIAKAEEGAERILQLETDVEQLEVDVADDQSELSYLKLRLRIIEIQTLPHVPSKERDQLADGIRRWKLDWADVDKRFHARRRKKGSKAILGWQKRSAEHTV